ncbi:hypothetical protein BH10BAC6_BH10BAC6_01560 [soil metagenome]
MSNYHEIQHAPRALRTLLTVVLLIEAVVMAIAFIGATSVQGSSTTEIFAFFVAAVVLPSTLIILLMFATLSVTVDESGVSLMMRPFQLKVRHYAWADIAEITVRPVSPMGEFGGWGIRGWGNKIGYIWAGNNGIDVLTTNGKRLIVSITDAELARKAIDVNRPRSVR